MLRWFAADSEVYLSALLRNHVIDNGPVPVHTWLFREPGSAPSAIEHFAWLSHVHGTVFLPASQNQPLCRLSRDNLKHFYLPNPSHQFNFLLVICVPCPRSACVLAYATLICTFYYYYYSHAVCDEYMVPAVSVPVGLSVEFARALFHVWLQEKDVQNVSAALKRSGVESKLMVSTHSLHLFLISHQPVC